MHKGIVVGFLLSNPFLIAQSVAGSGYVAPAPVSVAPGQIATFYLPGVVSTAAAAAGILSVTLQQTGANVPAPIQSLRSISLCPDNTATAQAACGSLLAVTVQIPYELVPVCPLCARPVSAVPPLLVFNMSGQSPTAIELNPLADEVHVLKSCDVALGPATPAPANLTGLPCAPLVTHAGGSLVSASSPAAVGETLTIWAFGLGQTSPAAVTGQPAKMAPSQETFNLDFNYQVNALPAKPYTGEPDRVPLAPLFAGLAPGYVGLYQVNFTVPAQPPNGTPPCTPPGTAAAGANVAQSNFTVSIGGQFSFDGAGICVATQIPVD
jgi:uncharacterized protein (TIGR03437 family)